MNWWIKRWWSRILAMNYKTAKKFHEGDRAYSKIHIRSDQDFLSGLKEVFRFTRSCLHSQYLLRLDIILIMRNIAVLRSSARNGRDSFVPA